VSPSLLMLIFPAAVAPIDFDLRSYAGTGACLRRGSNDIIVCARRSEADRQRLPAKEDRYPDELALPKAELGVGGGKTLGLRSEQADVGGFSSRRALVTLKVPL
jgi:hypothetical protein